MPQLWSTGTSSLSNSQRAASTCSLAGFLLTRRVPAHYQGAYQPEGCLLTRRVPVNPQGSCSLPGCLPTRGVPVVRVSPLASVVWGAAGCLRWFRCLPGASGGMAPCELSTVVRHARVCRSF
jgi:hypothetical protein